MTENWKTVKLGTLIEINNRSINRNFTFDEIEYIDTSSVTENAFGEIQKFKKDDAPSRAKRLVANNDVIYSTVRPIQRHYGFIKNAKPNTVVSTGFAVLTPKAIEPRFLYYYLSRDEIVGYLNGVAESNTTTFPAFNASLFESLEITAPESIEEQRRIAEILSALDEKIELNLEMNRTLERIAQATFKHWFVDFQFPGFDGELVDGLPKGWRIGSVLEIANLLSGGTPKTDVKEFWNGDIDWISAKDITANNRKFILTTEKQISEKGLKNSAAKLLPKYTTVVSARGTVGNFCLLSKETTISQSNYGLKARLENNDFFLFLVVANMIDMMKQFSYGTVFDTITTKTFNEMEITLPSQNIILQFEEAVKPIFEKMLLIAEENQTLTQIRNGLLPKLMSGKIRVAE